MYQLLTALLEPYTLLLLSLLGVLVWTCRRREQRRRSLTIAIALLSFLLLLSLPASGYLALRSLELKYPPLTVLPVKTDTLVVLAGDSYIDEEDGTTVRLGGETANRCLYAARLYERAGRCRIIVSGGPVDPSRSAFTLADAMRNFLVLVGVRPDDIVLERNSSTTFENARNTSSLLREQHPAPAVFLVTTASHMRRATRCFQRQGIEVIPAPCNHQTLHFDSSLSTFVPSVNGLQGVQRAFHEWLGLGWYFLRGRI